MFEGKSFQQGIKDLRRDVGEAGLAWVHATESAGKYLQTILPGVSNVSCEQSDDKYDLKKVITTKFYAANGSKIATCHAHGDGTWNLLFSPAGKTELSKKKTSPATEAALEVVVVQRIDEGGRVFHYGEMLNKPEVCRQSVSENNDELHRLKQTTLQDRSRSSLKPLFPRKMQPAEEVTTPNDENSGVLRSRVPSIMSTSRPDAGNPRQSQYGRIDDDILTPEQEDIAAGLSKDGLKGKEQRSLFQKMKAMPLDQQELILDRSKVLKVAAERERQRHNGRAG